MATLPSFFQGAGNTTNRPASLRAERDPYKLRALPLDDLFFFTKPIDNSRVEREADPRSGGRCLQAIGVACLLLALLGGVAAPNVANTLAGYKLQSLTAEERHLMEQRRALELREAELLSPQNLDQLARQRNLIIPQPGQVVHLEPTEGAVALVKK